MDLGLSLLQVHGYNAPETERMFARVWELLLQAGEALPRLNLSFWSLFAYYRGRSEYHRAKELAERRLELPTGGTEAERTLALTVLSPVGAWLPAPAGTRAVEGVRPEVRGGWVLKAEELEGTTLALRTGEQEHLLPEEVPGDALTALPQELREELRPLLVERAAAFQFGDLLALACEDGVEDVAHDAAPPDFASCCESRT